MPETFGRYELIAEIGRGGMADVKLARDGERLVVLKVLHEELAGDPQIVEMLRDEAKLSAQIRHDNVVEVYEHGEVNGRPFIAMEYLEGESLLAVLDKGVAGKRLDALSMTRVVADATKGLAAAHGLASPDGKSLGVVHHDISLGNIFVLYSGQVKLLDFGVAKIARRASSTDIAKVDPEKVFGKLAYMAPEKLDDKPGDRRSDIWSLGCVLWEALTNKRLFKGANDIEIVREVRYVNVPPPSTLVAEAPKELDAIVLKCLQRDPARRYPSANELATALESVLSAHSYPEKNYKIGTYMMQAFADVISARERLVREAAGPYRPSAKTIDAAFAGGDAPKRDSLPGLGIDEVLAGANQVVLPEGSTGADAMIATPSSAASAPQNPFDDDDEVAETIYDVVPANAEASRALRYEADPSWNRGKHGERLKELQRKTQELRDNPNAARRRKLIPYAAGGGVALLVVMIVAIKSCGGRKQPTAPVAKPADPAVVVDAAVARVEVDAPPKAVATEPENIEIEMPPDEANDKDKSRPKPTKSAQQYYAEGLAAWKKNDRKAAYALFTEGRRASSTYANNWYGLGLVHEKAGRKKDARTAYERYLKLAPKAPNGGKLRDHIKKNLM